MQSVVGLNTQNMNPGHGMLTSGQKDLIWHHEHAMLPHGHNGVMQF